MIVDFTVTNFRSIQSEMTFSMVAESGLERHNSNYTLTEEGKLAILRSAAILGANASGKSTLFKAMQALRWMVIFSGARKEGQSLPTYEPFKLDPYDAAAPITMELEFIVPSGIRYRYVISYLSNRVVQEYLFSYAKRQKAIVFQREATDTWETIRFGGTYKGGSRKFPFFANNSYLSRAGNDASAPESIREVYKYFRDITFVDAGHRVMVPGYLKVAANMKAVGDIVCLADTGVAEITSEENKNANDIRLPENMPEDLKEAILEQNRTSYKFWVRSRYGDLVEFDEDAMSDGTVRLFQLLPVILDALATGSPLLVDEMDAHFHTNLLSLLLQLFHDHEINAKGSQLIFTTHDTNVLDADILRRDQIWFVQKRDGVSVLRALDEFNKKAVRPDSPFESFYKDGRLGALPRLPYANIKNAVLEAVRNKAEKGE